jgi:very-short-patch-repair endonuclease
VRPRAVDGPAHGHSERGTLLPVTRPGIDPLTVLARSQAGLVTRQQLLESGWSASRIDRLGRPGGRGRRVLPRVYSLTTGDVTRRQQLTAALLYVGDGAQLTSLTALEVQEFRYAPRDGRVHVQVHITRRVASTPFVMVHRTHRVLPHRRVDGLAVVPVSRAAVDACRGLRSVPDATAVLAEAVQRRLCTLDMLAVELSLGHSAGSAVPRRALDTLRGGSESAPEADLLAVVQRSLVLPSPTVNPRLDVDGRVVIPDLAWLDVRLMVEVDSVTHHGLGPDAAATTRRRSALTAAGWVVLSISPQRIRDDPDGVLAEIEATYLLAAARSAQTA